MKRFLLLSALLVSTSPFRSLFAQIKDGREVILATRWNHQLVVLDARSLKELGHFVIGELAMTPSASPDGRTLFIQQPPPSEPHACCALFSLDLATGSMCQIVFPSSPAVVSRDGRLLFTQRGAVGVEVFDAQKLTWLPVIKAPGNYGLSISPDGRWLFGTTVWQGPSLDVFDIERGVLVRRLRLPDGLLPRGVWLGNKFYLYAHDGKQGNIWSVTPDTTELVAPKRVTIPITARDNSPIWQGMFASGDRLIVYEPVAWWLHPARRAQDEETSSGFFSVDSSSGDVAHLAPGIDFAQLLPSADGRYLYGINAGAVDGTRPASLLKLDGRTGAVLKRRALPRDSWFMSVAVLPESLIPRGELMTTSCQKRESGDRN